MAAQKKNSLSHYRLKIGCSVLHHDLLKISKHTKGIKFSSVDGAHHGLVKDSYLN